MNKYTQEQIDQACELRERGRSFKQIATTIGMNPSSVAHHCMTNGAVKPNPGGSGRAAMPYMSRGRTVRPFSPDEDEVLTVMSLSGATKGSMARRLGRTNSSIRNRLVALAYAEAKREATAS